MRLPIGYALGYPARIGTPFGRIDWAPLGRLDFEPPDTATFRCLALAYDAGRRGGTAPAWLSAANEVAVEAFLAGRLRWTEIADVCVGVLALQRCSPRTLSTTSSPPMPRPGGSPVTCSRNDRHDRSTHTSRSADRASVRAAEPWRPRQERDGGGRLGDRTDRRRARDGWTGWLAWRVSRLVRLARRSSTSGLRVRRRPRHRRSSSTRWATSRPPSGPG